jgi:molybdopterin-binding protein
VGVLVRPEDIILSLETGKTSARNIIKAKVARIVDLPSNKCGVTDIHLVTDNIHLISQITNESRNFLGIKKDDYVYAMFKATSPHVVREED